MLSIDLAKAYRHADQNAKLIKIEDDYHDSASTKDLTLPSAWG